MGTHPIFESDFDCLTEWKSSIFLLQRIVSQNLAIGYSLNHVLLSAPRNLLLLIILIQNIRIKQLDVQRNMNLILLQWQEIANILPLAIRREIWSSGNMNYQMDYLL